MVKLSVVIPVYNEIDYVVTVLQRVQGVVPPEMTLEIIIVDDAGTERASSYRILSVRKARG